MDPSGVSWNEDLQRYERQRRQDPGPTPDPNPRVGPMQDLDPYRGRFGAPNTVALHERARADAPDATPGRHTLRNEWHDPDRHKADLENQRASDARTARKPVPGAGPYTGGLRAPPVGVNNRSAREHLFDTMQHVGAAGARTFGLDPVDRNHPDEWLGNKQYNPNRGRKQDFNRSTRDKGCRLDDGRRDLFTVLQPEGRAKDPEDRAEDNWLGNMGNRPSMGRSKATEGMYVPTTHRGRRDLFAVISGRDPDEDDRSQDQWLGNMANDPARQKARPDRVEDELGVGLRKVKTSTKEWGQPQRVTILEGPGQLDPLIRPDLHPEEDFTDPDLRRGPKKVEPPPAPSGRVDFYPVINQDPNLKDDFGPRRRMYVKEPGSDTDPGKGSMLMYSNEYCSTLNRRGVM